jgi:hypothetical protein
MLEVFEAKKGGYTVSLHGTMLLSRYDPAGDASKIAEELLKREGRDRNFLLFGTALGLLPAALAASGVPLTRILAFEPDERLGDIAKAACPGLRLLSPMDDIPSWIEEGLYDRARPAVFGIESWKRAWSAEWSRFERFTADAVRTAVENVKVTGFFSRLWVSNLVANVKRYLERPEDTFIFAPRLPVQAPVLVAASGPSLDDRTAEIFAHREGFVVIAVLSAARTLLAAGIRPDAVAVSDAGVANKLHAAGIPSDIPILAGPFASGALLCASENPAAFYGLAGEIVSPTWRLSQPSVSIDAGDLARKFSSLPPVFAGFDLSYRLPEGSHSSRNALFELRRRNGSRLRTADSAGLGFFRRSDLEPDGGGGWTTSSFRTIAGISGSRFPGAMTLPGGLEREGWKIIDSLEKVADPTAARIGREALRGAFIRSADLESKARFFLEKVREAVRAADGEILRKWFVRERLAGLSADTALQCLKRKLG